EKLNGNGYPLNLKEDKIPIQSRMMTITDIYDALTAQDRPYKRAVPHERALDIIGYEVKGNLVDSDLFDMFVKGKVYELVQEK
ncbi:MAG: HD family phosphohydrolase, partial [Candidatus Scalindua sp.]|nr:HD family phosphohydrolase [Candidatus Scalindua sp.]